MANFVENFSSTNRNQSKSRMTALNTMRGQIMRDKGSVSFLTHWIATKEEARITAK
jgi:hypothetical protein